MSLVYYSGYSKLRSQVSRLKRAAVARFVAFHDIPDKAEANFGAKLHFLKRHTNVISFDDYVAGRLSSRKLNVVITFDDGYKSWLLKAAPALRALRLPATFFISSGFLGLSKERENEFVRTRLKTNRSTIGALTEADVRQLSLDGFTIGGHTSTHANLSELREASELVEQIRTDKDKLESITGLPVKYFSYPFGLCHNPVLDLPAVLKELGYSGAVTTVPGFNTPATDRYLLHRDLIGPTVPMWVARARIFGAADTIKSLKDCAALVSRRSSSASERHLAVTPSVR